MRFESRFSRLLAARTAGHSLRRPASFKTVDWAALKVASPQSLAERGFTRVEKGGGLNFFAPGALRREEGLHEAVFDYVHDGQSKRTVGLAHSVFSNHVQIFSVAERRLMSFAHGEGVQFVDLHLRGGLATESSTATPRPFDQLEQPGPRVVSLRVSLQALGIDRSIVGVSRGRTGSGFEISGADGHQYLIDPALVRQQRSGDMGSYRLPPSGMPAVGAERGLIRLAEPNGSARTDALTKGALRGELYSREFFEWFRRDLPATKRLISRLFSDHDPALLIERVTRELGEATLPLFLHPDVASRWGESLAFAKALRAQQPQLRCDELLYALEQRAGTTRLYRGLTLTEAEFNDINRTGLRAPGLRDPRRWMQEFYNEYSDDPTLTRHVQEGIRARTNFAGSASTFESYNLIQSFSMDPNVAKSVPYWLGAADHSGLHSSIAPPGLEPGKKLYLVTAQVPNWRISFASESYAGKSGRLLIGERTYLLGTDRAYEQYVPFSLPRAAFSIEPVDEIPARFAKVRR